MAWKHAVSLAAIAAAATGAVSTGAAAQTVPQTPPASTPPATTPPPSNTEQGVISYTPDFFAGARPATALEMVQRLPGFSFDSGGGVRGFSGGAGNVLIDGERPLSKTEALDETLRKIPASIVERIELIRGGAPGIDMQGRTVLANVVRRATTPLTGGVAISASVLWDGRVLPGFRAEAQRRLNGRAFELSLLFGQGADESIAAGHRVRVNGAGQTTIVSELDAAGQGTREWLTGAYETPLWGGHLRLNGVVQLTPFVGNYEDRLTIPGGVELEHDSFKRENYEIGARFTRALGSNMLWETVFLEQLGRNASNVFFDSASVDRLFNLDSHTGETILHTSLAWRAGRNLSVEFGGEGAFNWLESETQLVVNNTPVVLPAANVRVEELRGEVFGQVTWRARPTVNIEAGIRFEASTITSSGDTTVENTLYYPKPRLVLTWSPNRENQIRLRVEREVGQLNFNDFVAASSAANTGTVIAGNPDIRPQQAWVFEAAYERRFWTNGVVSLTVRRSNLTDVVDRIPLQAGNTVIDAPGNIGDGFRDEVAASISIPLRRFGIHGALLKSTVTWRRTEVTDPVTGLTREISLSQGGGGGSGTQTSTTLHPLDWDIHFTQDLPAWRLNWGVDVYGSFRETQYRVTEIETRELHTYVTIFGEYKPWRNVIIRAELQNVTARNAIRIREVYTGPRNTSPLSYIDTRDLSPGPQLLVRIRRTF